MKWRDNTSTSSTLGFRLTAMRVKRLENKNPEKVNTYNFGKGVDTLDWTKRQASLNAAAEYSLRYFLGGDDINKVRASAFSKKLTDKLDEKIPLDTERGYHVHFKNCENLISRPVVFSNRGFGMTPMDVGSDNENIAAAGDDMSGGEKDPARFVARKQNEDMQMRRKEEMMDEKRAVNNISNQTVVNNVSQGGTTVQNNATRYVKDQGSVFASNNA